MHFVGNGTIEFNEFVKMMEKKLMEGENYEDELREAFKREVNFSNLIG